MAVKFGIIADDFTGASDIASFLNLSGAKTILVNEIPENNSFDYSSYDAIVIALKSRSIDKKDAIQYTERSYELFKSNKVENVYFKYASTFDSTTDGNIGPVADYLLEKTGQKYSLLVPSFPDNNRVVKEGILYVDEKKIEDTHMSKHPLNPMTESRLVTLIESQSKYKALNISIENIIYFLKNREEFSHYLLDLSSKYEHFYIIPDYYENHHGKLIAELFNDLEVYTGASVFGGWIYQIKNNKITNEYPTLPKLNLADNFRADTGLVLAGSLSKATRLQVETFKNKNYPFYEIKNEKIYNDYDLVLEEIKKFILSNKNKVMLIHTEDRKFDKTIDDLLENIISDSAVFALNNDIDKIVVAGGETSGAVVTNIDTNNFQIGPSISPGVPILMAIEKDKKSKLVLKSGNFGNEDFFEEALYLMGEI